VTELVVLFGSDLDLDDYRRRHERGAAPDRLPYGTEHAPGGWTIVPLGGRAGAHLRRRFSEWAKRRLGLDLPHAWHHRRALRAARYIYCHSEIDYLAVAAVLRVTRARRPCLVGQTLWLFNEWPTLPRWRRAVVRWCLARVDLFIANARPNAELGRTLVPGARHEFVPFGVSATFADGASLPAASGDLVLAVGNDRARDWETLLTACSRLPARMRLRIASSRRIPGAPTSAVAPTASIGELKELYRSAAALAVVVTENAHASGITTLLEAAAAGCPAVASRAGGLDDYFSDEEVLFVPVGDSTALTAALLRLAEDPDERGRRSALLRAAFRDRAYTNAEYWQRVVERIAEHAVADR